MKIIIVANNYIMLIMCQALFQAWIELLAMPTPSHLLNYLSKIAGAPPSTFLFYCTKPGYTHLYSSIY